MTSSMIQATIDSVLSVVSTAEGNGSVDQKYSSSPQHGCNLICLVCIPCVIRVICVIYNSHDRYI